MHHYGHMACLPSYQERQLSSVTLRQPFQKTHELGHRSKDQGRSLFSTLPRRMCTRSMSLLNSVRSRSIPRYGLQACKLCVFWH